MAEVLPFRGLRYNPVQVGDLSTVIAPPYDVISPQEQRTLHDRSPFNVIRVEYGEERSTDYVASNRYTRAAENLKSWTDQGVLVEEETPAFYLYDQGFLHGGRRIWRRGIFAAVRLEPWETGTIRPHEFTLSKPKEDRLNLLRATRTNVSPVFSLYESGSLGAVLDGIAASTPPVVDVTDSTDQRHVVRRITDETAVSRIIGHFAGRHLYIADGHHRYETALAYQKENESGAEGWNDNAPENFVLMVLVAAEDPGLVILPIHRLVKVRIPAGFKRDLEKFFNVEDVTPKSWDSTAVQRLIGRLTASGQQTIAFGCAGLEEERLHLLTLRDPAAVDAVLPKSLPPTWKKLDVSILQGVILDHLLGISEDRIAQGGVVDFSHDEEEAVRLVEEGRFDLCFLLNPTRALQMLAVADSGVRLPQKSTFFYPKLPTGVVMRSLNSPVSTA